jgi:hypothetical protein
MLLEISGSRQKTTAIFSLEGWAVSFDYRTFWFVTVRYCEENFNGKVERLGG